ncbi:MAG: pirin family protein [Propionibacteriales bacterium]|nr:pirin family protein [Propionibacteriales bacterium]
MEIRRGSDRFVDRVAGRLSRHGFSFGPHFDPERLSFGPLVCHDDHVIGPGIGFEEHAHEALEIVTWVVSGSVVHTDATGATATLVAGDCGVLSAGSGVRHSEIAGPDGPARFVQVWLTPDDASAAPAHATASVVAEPGAGLVRVVGEGGPLTVGLSGATFDVARLEAGEKLTLPAAHQVYGYITTGALLRFSLAEPLSAGDGFCLTDQQRSPQSATSYDVTAAVPTEILVWTFA